MLSAPRHASFSRFLCCLRHADTSRGLGGKALPPDNTVGEEQHARSMHAKFSVRLEKAIKKLEPRFCDGCACKELARRWTVAHVARNL